MASLLRHCKPNGLNTLLKWSQSAKGGVSCVCELIGFAATLLQHTPLYLALLAAILGSRTSDWTRHTQGLLINFEADNTGQAYPVTSYYKCLVISQTTFQPDVDSTSVPSSLLLHWYGMASLDHTVSIDYYYWVFINGKWFFYTSYRKRARNLPTFRPECSGLQGKGSDFYLYNSRA